MIKRISLPIALAVVFAGCSQSAVDQGARGAELLAPFKSNLKSALMKGMADGPVEAISACRIEAPAISASLSAEGVVMGRSSHKLRNPDNVPPRWLEPLLSDYAEGVADLAPRTLAIEDGRIGYVEPILVQPLCLTCHGEELPDEVASRIHELYPDDRATGFEEGDFRGVFWVEFPEHQTAGKSLGSPDSSTS